MDQNPSCPSLESIDVAQVRQLLPGRDQRVLQRVLRGGRLAQDPIGDREERIADIAYESGERLSVTTSGKPDIGRVHTDLLSAEPLRRGLPTMSRATSETFS